MRPVIAIDLFIWLSGARLPTFTKPGTGRTGAKHSAFLNQVIQLPEGIRKVKLSRPHWDMAKLAITPFFFGYSMQEELSSCCTVDAGNDSMRNSLPQTLRSILIWKIPWGSVSKVWAGKCKKGQKEIKKRPDFRDCLSTSTVNMMFKDKPEIILLYLIYHSNLSYSGVFFYKNLFRCRCG